MGQNKEDKSHHVEIAPCPYNKGVNCPVLNRKCDSCGWYPPVAEERKKKILGDAYEDNGLRQSASARWRGTGFYMDRYRR